MQVILESLIKKYGDRCLLEDLTFEFHSGKKSVLVGKNGSGKSTILSIIAGQLEPDAGRVVTTKGTIALMEQKLSGDLSRTIFQACGEIFADLVEQERQITEMHDRFEQLSDREQQQYATLVEAFEASGGYDWQRRIENVLLGVGFLKEQFEKKLSQ